MQTYEHCKTTIFTLIGRRVVLHTPYCGCTEGTIVEKIGPARFGCHLQQPDGHLYMSGVPGRPATVDFHRDEFALPPLPREERKATYLPDDYDDFVYANERATALRGIPVPPPVYERWAFSESELADPGKCESNDELVAYVDLDDGFGGTDGQQIVIYRNGRASNRYADGTVGVPEALSLLAEAEESLLHEDGGDTFAWKSVVTNKEGTFLHFLSNPLDLPKP